ncbi:MAG: gliding motility-associated ABC transporter ATP-binding subunit GldA [Bacteroidia bacterium]|nr:gliding motility-associated ABC transporter ATP-binding subunit GldA [Bacteroidia bacterium]
MSIIVKNVSKFYGAQKALDEVSFSISTGSITGFIGPNGAGKTTMMKIITGFIPPTSGEVTVNDLDVMENPLETRRLIGYLPENNPLYLDMYIREYLLFVCGIYKLGRNSVNRINEIIEQTGLQAEEPKKIGQLSKGYRQRVGLAQALIHNPEVLILDEPTSGLDPNQIMEIRGLISELGKQKTVMLSTHIMQEVSAICDRVIIINNGKIVADDTAAGIQAQGSGETMTILVEFSDIINHKNLEKIEGITRVIPLKDNNWLVQCIADKDPRTDIFNFAVQNKLAVLSMQKQEKSLEEAFYELTR